MVALLFLAIFFSLTGYSSAAYCLCKAGGNDLAYQSTIDWACGNGANCGAIQENGACYQPNNAKSHCDYAANSYYQNKGQTPDSCNFSGTASQSPTPPTTVVSGCSYPAGAGSTTPTTGVPSTTPGTSTGITPSTGTGPGTSPSTGTGTGTNPGTGTGTGTNPGTGTGTGTNPGTGTGGTGTGTNPGIGIYSPPGVAPYGMLDPSGNGSPSLVGNFLSVSLALLPCLLVLWG